MTAVKTNFLFLVLASLALVACDRPASSSDKAKIQFQIPKTNPNISSARKVGPVSSVLKQDTVSASAAGDWGLIDPATMAEFNCFAVFVGAPEITLNESKCQAENNLTSFEVGAGAGFANAGTLELDVTAGVGRTFYLVGISAETPAACVAANSTSFLRKHLSAPYILAEKKFDLSPGEVFVKLSADFASRKRVDSCTGSMFAPAFGVPARPIISVVKSEFTIGAQNLLPSGTTTISVTTHDANNQIVNDPNAVISFLASGGTSQVSFSAVTNNGNGTYTATVTGQTNGTALTITPIVDGIPLLTTRSLVVLGALVSLSDSTVAVSTSGISSGSTVTVTITLKDSTNAPFLGVVNVLAAIGAGSSSFSTGTVTSVGNGVYTVLLTGITAGSSTNIGATVDGTLITSAQPTVAVAPGALSVSGSTMSIASSTVLSGSTVNITMVAKDAAGNLITGTGRSPTMAITGGTSTGSFAVTENADGTATGVFTGNVAGTAVTVRGYYNGVILPTSAVALTVLPGPATTLAISGPTTIQSATCTTPYTITFRDAAGNSTTSGSARTLSLGGGAAGASHANATCSSVASTISATAGQSSAQFYYRDSGTGTATVTAAASGLTSGSLNITLTPTWAWLGASAQPRVGLPNGFSAATLKGEGFSAPAGITYDGTYVYVADNKQGRVVRYHYPSLTYAGWVGTVSISPTGPDASCITTNPGAVTPGWCTGGQSQQAPAMLPGAGGITTDGSYLYVTDSTTHKIVKINALTGQYIGWIGVVNAALPTGGDTGCAGAAMGTITPGWCIGGNSAQNAGAGGFNTPSGIDFYAGYLYVADKGNHRIKKINAVTGQPVGWIGKVGTPPTMGDAGCNGAAVNSVTPGWCLDGAATTGNGEGHFTSPIDVKFEPTTQKLFIVDGGNNRIQRWNLTSTPIPSGWIGRIGGALPSNGPDNFCTSPAMSTPTPGWCVGGVTTTGTGDGSFTNPRSFAFSSSEMFVFDGGNARIMKYNFTSGQFLGWSGGIQTSPTGPGACSIASPQALTPTWCMGGTAMPGANDGFYQTPSTALFTGMVTAGTDLLVADGANARVTHLFQSNGTSQGFTGAVALASEGWTRETPPTAIRSQDLGAFDFTTGRPGDFVISGNELFVLDSGNQAIKRYSMQTMKQTGWVGTIGRSPTMGTCIGQSPGSFASGWCTDGESRVNTAGTYLFTMAAGMTTDGNYLYVVEQYRILRFQISTGAYAGWLGRIGSSPSGGDAGCNAASAGGLTPGWCTGGGPQAGNTTGDGNMHNARAIQWAAGNLFVSDAYFRVLNFNAATGAFNGWTGKVATAPTGCTYAANVANTGWCMGGTSVTGIHDGAFSTTFIPITFDGTYLYFGDGNRIQKFNLGGNFYGWTGRIGTSPGAGGDSGCTGAAAGSLTPGWCMGGASQAGTQLTGGFSVLQAITVDTNSIYAGDATLNRIIRYDRVGGTYVGWKGSIAAGSSLTGGAGCAGATGFTPNWCLGGNAVVSSGAAPDSGLAGPTALKSVGDYLYTIDYLHGRVLRIPH